jgi:hypothetical protein
MSRFERFLFVATVSLGIGIVVVANVAQHDTNNLRAELTATHAQLAAVQAELVATRTAFDEATIAADSGAFIATTRCQALGEMATCVRVLFRDGKPGKQFVILRAGKVEVSEPGLTYAVTADWGSVEKWR